jgi:hypothetical protein
MMKTMMKTKTRKMMRMKTNTKVLYFTKGKSMEVNYAVR